MAIACRTCGPCNDLPSHFGGVDRQAADLEGRQERQTVRHLEHPRTGVEPARWWSTILFGDAVPDVLRLSVGDPIALAGNVEAEVYTPEGGEPRVSWKFTADAVLTARKAKREGQS